MNPWLVCFSLNVTHRKPGGGPLPLIRVSQPLFQIPRCLGLNQKAGVTAVSRNLLHPGHSGRQITVAPPTRPPCHSEI